MASTKKATAKKAAPKKAPAKKTTTKVRTVSAASRRATAIQSFRPMRSDEPFFTFRITHQTLYWLILSGIVLLLGIWVVDINTKVQKIYDEIDATNSAIYNLPDKPIKQPAATTTPAAQ